MAQIDDLQAYTNFEMPRRPALLTFTITAYDGDPNDGGAPAIVQNSPLGTLYRETTNAKWWRKTETVWEDAAGTVYIETTLEDLSVTLNPDTGTDPTADDGPMVTQADIDAWGTFATQGGLYRIIPRRVIHAIDFTYETGTFAIDDSHFDGFDRLEFGSWVNGAFSDVYGTGWETYREGSIDIKTAGGMAKIVGTPTMTVQSNTGGYSLVMTADPAFSANQYRSKWLKIVAGTGAGQYKAIRSHAGTAFEIAGRFDPIDGTSQVEVWESTTILTYASSGPALTLQGMGTVNTEPGTVLMRISDLEIQCSGTYASFQLIKTEAVFVRTTVLGILELKDSRTELNDLIVDANGQWGAILCTGGTTRCGTDDASWLVRGSTSYAGIGVVASPNRPAFLYLYKGSIDDNAGGGVDVFTSDVSIDVYSGLSSSGNSGYGITLIKGCTVVADLTYTSAGRIIDGATGELLIDGEAALYSDLVDVNDSIEGPAGSRVTGY